MDSVAHLKGKNKESETILQVEEFITNSTKDLNALKKNIASLGHLQKDIVSKIRNIYEKTQTFLDYIPDAPYAPPNTQPTPWLLSRKLRALKYSINHSQRVNHSDLSEMLHICENSSETHTQNTQYLRVYLILHAHKRLRLPEPMIAQLKRLAIEYKQISPVLSKIYNRIKCDQQANKELYLPHFINVFLTTLYLKHPLKNIYIPKLIKKHLSLKQKINLSLFDDHAEQLAKIFDSRCRKICFDSKVSQLTKPSQTFIWSEFHIQDDILKSFFKSYQQIQKDGRNYARSIDDKIKDHQKLNQEVSGMHHELCKLYTHHVQKTISLLDMYPTLIIPNGKANVFRSALLSNLIHPRVNSNIHHARISNTPITQVRLNVIDIMIKSNFLCFMSAADHLTSVSDNLLKRNILQTKSIQYSSDQMHTLALRLEKKFPFLVSKRKEYEKEPMLNFSPPVVEL